MDHLTQPLARLFRKASYFVVDEDLRLLHVTVDDVLRTPAMDVLSAMQWRPEARRAVFVLRPPEDKPGSPWAAWAGQLYELYGKVRDAFGKDAIALPRPKPPDATGTAVVDFARQVHRVSQALSAAPAPTAGIVVVLDGAHVGEAQPFMRHLRELVTETPSLANVKWVWVDGPDPIGSSWVAELGQALAMRVACKVDPEAQRRELDDRVAAMIDAVGAVGPAGAGAATSPAPHKPHRRAAPARPRPDESPATAPPNPVLPLLRGIRAMRAGDVHSALEHQRAAAGAAQASGATGLAVDMDMVLATYMVQALSADRADLRSAALILEQAAARASSAGLRGAEAKACLVLGAVAALMKDETLTARAFRQAANAATEADLPALAIEALRMLSDVTLAFGRHLEERTVELLSEAVDIGALLPPLDVGATAAAECARRLAEGFERRGEPRMARELAALSDYFAAPERSSEPPDRDVQEADKGAA